MNLVGKKILLGVSGSIAAYKSALLVRLLVKAGADVRVIMTQAATEFITPLTLSTLSKKPVLSTYIKEDGTGQWNNHVELGLWADAFLIAPATAHTLARCANGLCDDLLTAVYLSARCPVFFAPAMDVDMCLHGSTLHNIERLRAYGNGIIEAGYGELASGLVGEGRLAEPEALVDVLERHFAQRPVVAGKRVLITAGPTQEALDPVRYISNHSTGKMGYALARAFAQAGAQVTVVSGPVALESPSAAVQIVKVGSARQMLEATQKYFSGSDLVIFAAAVADYTPTEVANQKIKKNTGTFQLNLTKTPDIALTLGQQKRSHQILVGFALETEHEIENARRKLEKKNLDFIVLNSLNDPGAGFAYDTNKIAVIDRQGLIRHFELKNKDDVAQDILDIIIEKWSEA